MTFTDAEFMTAREKALVLKNWERFLRHGMKREHFAKKLYEHLHLHCGFIAHHNIHGFYSEYFEAVADIERFFENFCSYTAQNFGACAEFDDLNRTMRDAYKCHKRSIARQAEQDVGHRIATLEACVQRAKEDIALRISRRELATILAALRFHQDENLQRSPDIPDQSIREIATDGGRFQALTSQKVSKLCQRMNTEECQPSGRQKGDSP